MRIPLRGGLALFPAVALTACGILPSEPARPTRADIEIDGTAGDQLELVVSTSFFETRDEETLELQQVLVAADTTLFLPPHAASVQLTSQGMVLVRVTNHEASPASIRLRVVLDTGREYDDSTTLEQGASHTYYFVFTRGRA